MKKTEKKMKNIIYVDVKILKKKSCLHVYYEKIEEKEE